MVYQNFIEAANQLSELADEFKDNDEISFILRAGSSKMTKMAIERGAIIKTASKKDDDDAA